LFENEIEVFLKDKMCIDVKNLYEKISSFSSSEQCVIYNFIKKCITQINSMQNNINANTLDFHEHPIVKEITNFYNNLIDNIKEDEAKIVLDSIRQAFSHFAVGGLLQLYERQENEVWYPKILLTEVLIPNDISLLPDYVEIYRGCDISEFNLKEFNQAWTTKQNIASDFAFKHYSNQKWFKSENRVILKATINKNDIFYAKKSGEYEVVVDSGKLINVEIFKMNPKISVVMSVYNGQDYLDEAIESILNQTYKDFEFIIINDGSIDNSLEIIKKYQNLDERIVLISRENKGLVASLNEGIEKAKGKYIARMDADDICLSTRFEEQIEYMKKNNLDLCGSWIETFNEKNILNIWECPETHRDIEFRSFFMCSFAHPSVMIKKIVFDKLKYENETAEDYRLWCDILANGYKVGNIQKVLLKYRLHNNQLTQTKSKELMKSANNIRLSFSKKINSKISTTIENYIDVQNNCTISKFDNLIKDIFNYANQNNISKKKLDFVLKVFYNNSSPKTPFIYYKYFKNTKNSDKKFKEEMNMFLKSFVIFSRDSKIYQFLKKLKNKGIQ
jgi:glycosyltransferase involved in cell wall biosynthesis